MYEDAQRNTAKETYESRPGSVCGIRTEPMQKNKALQLTGGHNS